VTATDALAGQVMAGGTRRRPVRLFVSVQPPDDVLDALAGLARPQVPGARWVGREQWHVTLRFFGEVDDPAPVAAALASAPLRATEAVAGPGAVSKARRVLWLPVAGLDELAAGVAAATEGLGPAQDEGAFQGHLTLARAPRRGRLPVGLAGRVPPFTRRWPVTELRVVRSHLGQGPPRYEDLAVVPLA
jgi:2'-5' RNA ligase